MLLYSNKSDSYLLVISHSIGNGGIIKSYVYHECNCDPQFRLNRSRLCNSNILGVLSLTWKKRLLHLWNKDSELPRIAPIWYYQNNCLKLGTGKSFSEALILVSTNPQYDKRLFIELRVQYMKIPSSEHVENMLRTQIVLFWHSEQFMYTTCSVWACSFHLLNW